MRILIVDDEAPARARMARLLGEISVGQMVGEAADGVEAIKLVEAYQPDVVLLDVRMPRMDGLETARHLGNMDTPPAVIFTTAYDEYALAAFDTNAVAYLLKPVRADKLEDALKRAARPTRAQLESLRKRHQRLHLSSRIGERLALVPVASVSAFIADQKYVSAYHDGGELLINDTLKELEQEFSERFLRIHRNALVAVDRVVSLETLNKGGGLIQIRGHDAPLEVSRRHLVEVKRRLREA